MKLGNFILLILGIGLWIGGLIFTINYDSKDFWAPANCLIGFWIISTMMLLILFMIEILPKIIKHLNKKKLW